MEYPIRVLAWPAFSNRAANPYNWLLYTALADLGVQAQEFSTARLLFGRANILHLHWSPTSRIRGTRRGSVIARASSMILAVVTARMRGMRVVWTAHNLESRDRAPQPALEEWYWKILPRYVDGFLSLTRTGVDRVRNRYPGMRNVPAFVTPHGHYRTAYPSSVTREEARRELGIVSTARVFAFVGQVRPYKNVPALLRAFSAMPDPDALLLVAGMIKLNRESRRELEDLARRDSRMRLFPEFIPDDRLQFFVRAADLITLPFREALNSGSVILALSFDRPVLVPRNDTFAELSEDVGGDWVIMYDGEVSARGLEAAMKTALRIGDASPPLDSMDWRHVARLTLDGYRQVLGR